MELREFVSKTLIDIAEGVRDSQEYFHDNMRDKGFPMSHKVLYDQRGRRKDFEINFQVAVTSEDSKDIGVKSKINVVDFIKFEANRDKYAVNQNVSKISFKVPLVYPLSPIPTEK